MEYEDTTLVCEECNNEFVFTGDEQKFFSEKGFQTPKRCKPCRDKKKMSRGGGARSGRGGSMGFGEKKLYSVVCSDCGNETQVPFKPSGDRPVYCRDCFQNHR